MCRKYTNEKIVYKKSEDPLAIKTVHVLNFQVLVFPTINLWGFVWAHLTCIAKVFLIPMQEAPPFLNNTLDSNGTEHFIFPRHCCSTICFAGRLQLPTMKSPQKPVGFPKLANSTFTILLWFGHFSAASGTCLILISLQSLSLVGWSSVMWLQIVSLCTVSISVSSGVAAVSSNMTNKLSLSFSHALGMWYLLMKG